jgi:hypothetical protein
MSDHTTVDFALTGSIAGKPISPREGLSFSKFIEFNREVQEFVVGSESKGVLNDLQVQIEEGSYLLRVIVPAGLLISLTADTARLAQQENLSEMDRKRADIVLRWQEHARKEPSLSYSVRSPRQLFKAVNINSSTEFRIKETIQWVDVERYLIGMIMEWGGTVNTNVHLRIRNSRELICIDAKHDQIGEQKQNLVFHNAIVHVRAKENLKTGELKDYRLIDLREYKTTVDESSLQELFAKGAKAWGGVKDATDWVEELRGGAHA